MAGDESGVTGKNNVTVSAGTIIEPGSMIEPMSLRAAESEEDRHGTAAQVEGAVTTVKA